VSGLVTEAICRAVGRSLTSDQVHSPGRAKYHEKTKQESCHNYKVIRAKNSDADRYAGPAQNCIGSLEESAARFEDSRFYVNQRAMEIAIDAIQEVQVSLDEM
jgi:hypothetical protein